MANPTNQQVMSDIALNDLSDLCESRLDSLYKQYLAKIPSLELKTAIEYTLFSSGKRIRPMLVYATGSIFHTDISLLDAPAAAVELIHTYCLIHDDLPSIDNADLRRGKPTCHKAFGDGMAILAGDGIQSLAFQILTDHLPAVSTNKRLEMISLLSQATGPYGVAAGQALDITLMENKEVSAKLIEDIYQLKTGKLIQASILLGQIAAKDDDEINQAALREFGSCLGLAFQIQDDILELESATDEIGKAQHAQVTANRASYPKACGIQKAKDRVNTLYQQALESINYLGTRGRLLRELTTFMLQRKR